MQSKTKFANRKKIPAKEAIEKIDEICIDKIGEEYRVKIDNDDSGSLLNVLFEEKCPDLAKELIQNPFYGWRRVLTIVPEGYLAVFYPLNKDDSM